MKNLSKWRGSPCSWIGKQFCQDVSSSQLHPQIQCDLNQNSRRSSCGSWQADPEVCTERRQRARIAILENTLSYSLNPRLTAKLSAHMALTREQAQTSTTAEPRNKPIQAANEFSGERNVFQYMAPEQLDIHV